MLRKPALHQILGDADAKEFHLHYQRMMKIRLDFHGLEVPGMRDGQIWMPACHHASHAYAQAFGVQVVDGEKVFLTSSRTWFFGRCITGKVSRYSHSWNVFEFESGKKVIFDLIPDETCSLTPIVLEYPHPAYTEPRDGVAKRCIREKLSQKQEIERIILLSKEFKRIAG